MRQLLITTVVTLVLVVGCAQTSSEQPTELPEVALSQEEINPLPKETLSTELQQAVLAIVGEQQNLSPDLLQIKGVEAADWPDACLGISGPDELCAQVMTPGWAVTVTDGQQTWRYRTNLDATQVKLDDSE